MTTWLLNRWTATFRASDERGRASMHGLVLAIAAYLALYGLYSQWYIEDAAIVFAYARNAATGLGYVPWPGGERVEGFSDPLWTLGLTALAVLQISPWIAAKIAGASLGVATLVGVARWARLVAGDVDPRIGAAAAVLVAVSPQFAAWNASGLENPLLAWLVVWGSIAVLEGRPGVVAGTWWGLVAITRPEGLLYGFAAGVVGVFAARRRAPGWALGFTLGVALPLAGWMAVKLPYFAWPFPNTYYAKLGEVHPPITGWNAPGLSYLRDWALRTGHGFLLPLYALGLAGPTPWRVWIALGYSALAMFLWVPGLAWTEEIPGWPFTDSATWEAARVAVLAIGAAALPLLTLGRPGWPARLLAAWIASAGMFFAVYASGDWMVGFRWLALPAVVLGILLADALYVWIPRMSPGVLGAAAVGVGGVVVGAGAAEINRYVRSADTSPFDVQDRVAFHTRVARKLALELPPVIGEVDMGAHLWWYRSPVMDYAGLVDVPFAQQHWDPRFLDEYVYRQIQPEIIHVHGNWTNRSRLRARPGYAGYVTIDGYTQAGPTMHEGSAIRRELLVGVWRGPRGREARFSSPQGIADLIGWDVPDVVAAGGPLPLRTGWRRSGMTTAFQVFAYLADDQGIRALWEIPPAWGWLPADRWRSSEVIVTRHLPMIPADVPAGTYDLGIAVIGRKGPAWPAAQPASSPRFASGEVVWPGAVTVAPPDVVGASIAATVDEARALAATGDCEGARKARIRAQDMDRAPDDLRIDIGRCLVRRGDRASAADAVRWAPGDPVVRAEGVRLAGEWEAEGLAALGEGDAEGAHTAWTAALEADPLRPWLRRRVEALRRDRLGLVQGRLPPPPAEPIDPTQRGG